MDNYYVFIKTSYGCDIDVQQINKKDIRELRISKAIVFMTYNNNFIILSTLIQPTDVNLMLKKYDRYVKYINK